MANKDDRKASEKPYQIWAVRSDGSAGIHSGYDVHPTLKLKELNEMAEELGIQTRYELKKNEETA